MECPSVNASASVFLQNQILRPTSTFTSISTPISFPRPTTCIRISRNSHIRSPHIDFPTISLEKIAVSLVTGSVLLTGCLSRPTPALALPPAQPGVTTEMAWRKEEADDDVEIMWEGFWEKNPKDVDALKILVYEKMRKGKNGEAVNYVERLIELERDEVEWRLLQALCYDLMEDYTTAKRLFMDILKDSPLLVRALHGLAMVMHKNNEGPAVYEMLNEALQLARGGKRVTEMRNISIVIAQMNVVKGELKEGLLKFQGLIDQNPRDFRPYLFQGIILSLLDRMEEAEQQFMTYHSLAPEEFPQKRFLDDIVLEAKKKISRTSP